MMRNIHQGFLGVLMSVVTLCTACEGPTPTLPVLQHPDLSRVNTPDWPALDRPVWSPDGSKLLVSGGTGGEARPTGQIYILDTSTGELRLIEETDYGFRGAQSWSPDGSEIAFSASLDVEGIWVTNADGGGQPRFLSDGHTAAWSPDGQQMAIIDLVRDEEAKLWTRSIRILDLNTGNEQVVSSMVGGMTDSAGLSWSPDGAQLAFVFGAGERDGQPVVETDLYTLDLATGDIAQLTHGGFSRSPMWSPDGDLIAYIEGPSIMDGQLTITRADGSCRIQPLSVTDIAWLAWSPDGSRMALEFIGYSGIYVMDVTAVLGEDFLTTGPVCP